jgi:hypothetical protein
MPSSPPASCKLTLPDKTSCSYEPGIGNVTSPNRICRVPNISRRDCAFEVHITTPSLSGIYTLTYILRDTTAGEETFHVYLRTGKNIQISHTRIILSSRKALRFLIVRLT